MLKFLSVKSIVIAPANTGNESSNRNAVINTAQTNRGVRFAVIPGALMLVIVTIKLIAPRIEDTPARCKEYIAQSTDPPECAWIPLNGGYTVQPVPTPASTNEDETNKTSEGGNSQKLILLRRGNDISQAPIIIGTNQFPNPPMAVGITKKKIIKKA